MSGEEVAGLLRSMLRRDELGPGDRLGDERSLAAELGVTRHRLREALGVLEEQGLLRRRIGRGGGVFVSDGRIERNLNTIEGLPDITRVQGVRLTTTLLRCELTLARPHDLRQLRLAPGAYVHHVLRLRNADGRGLSLEDTRVPADLFPDLARHDLSHLYRLFRDVYDIHPELSDESVEVAYATIDEADTLGVLPGTTLLRLTRVTQDAGGRPIECATERFVADRMRFHLRRYGVVGNAHVDQRQGDGDPDVQRPVSRRPATRSVQQPHAHY
ncbi:GntR family transcriptional regulator [Cellulomonas bogoriensis 69B4 = DSM 16987]|uniref:GntR family transcriptional regulator n=1 Tax=Cellulomonas bogoriensis 69B4 = DSM 16987 TaxID=1386082 RepID=A0A0A0C1E3_9CELL|nr:GntR family transcriptional regulator [Cellulomonas bogoriensis 69B4 = DSM 16987]